MWSMKWRFHSWHCHMPHATLYDLEEDAPVQMWVMIEHASQKWDH